MHNGFAIAPMVALMGRHASLSQLFVQPLAEGLLMLSVVCACLTGKLSRHAEGALMALSAVPEDSSCSRSGTPAPILSRKPQLDSVCVKTCKPQRTCMAICEVLEHMPMGMLSTSCQARVGLHGMLC